MEKDPIQRLRKIYGIFLTAVLYGAFLLAWGSLLMGGMVSELFSEESAREDIIADVLPGKRVLLAPYRFVNSLFDRRYYPDGMYFVLPNDQIISGSRGRKGEETAKQIRELYEFCKAQDRDFLYVLCPGKPVSDGDTEEYGIPCRRNYSADIFLEKLKEYRVPYLDLRPVIKEAAEEMSGGDPYAMFYKSDHHWTADAGPIAAEETASALNELYGTGLDPEAASPERMNRVVMKPSYVGELGSKLLGPFGCSDHLVVVTPKDKVKFHYVSPMFGLDRTGGFDVIFHEDRRLDAVNAYYRYMGGNDHLGYIENAGGGDSSILLVKDSYACVVIPFLALTTGKLTWWDVREDTGLITYLREHPEVKTVVVMYSTSFAVDSGKNAFS